MEVITEIELWPYDENTHKTAFKFLIVLEKHTAKDTTGNNYFIQVWNYNCSPIPIKHFNDITSIDDKLNIRDVNGNLIAKVNSETAKQICEEIINQYINHPDLHPYFLPREFSDLFGKLDEEMAEAFDDFNENNIEHNTPYSIYSNNIAVLKSEQSFNAENHQTNFKKQIISENELIKNIPNKLVGDAYFGESFSRSDVYQLIEIHDTHLYLITDENGRWKFFFGL